MSPKMVVKKKACKPRIHFDTLKDLIRPIPPFPAHSCENQKRCPIHWFHKNRHLEWSF